MDGAQRDRPEARHAPEVGLRHIPVAQLRGDDGQVVGEQDGQGVGVAALVAGLDRLLQHTPGRHRVARPHVQGGELAHGAQQLGVAVGQARASAGNGALERGPRAREVAGVGQQLGIVTDLREGRRRGHNDMLPVRSAHCQPSIAAADRTGSSGAPVRRTTTPSSRSATK